MAYANTPLIIQNYVAAEALSANRLVIIDPSDDTKVRYPEADYDTQLVGVTLEAAASGEPIDVCELGIALVKVDGAAANIAYGDPIAAHGAIGEGRKADTTADVTTQIIGSARSASTADGDIIPVLVVPSWYATESS